MSTERRRLRSASSRASGALATAALNALPHAIAAVVLTWPLVLHLGSSIPLGTEPTGTVPLFNLWTLRWNADRLAHGLSGYWDAPIFHPTAGAFALSDPQPLTGLAFAPIWALTGNGALAYNLVLLAILALNGWMAARFTRRLGAGLGPSIVAGVVVQALPFVSNELGVLQLVALYPIFGVLIAIYDWTHVSADAPAPKMRLWPAARTGLWLAVVFGTSSYYGLFLVLVLMLTGWLLVDRRLIRAELVAEVGVALAACVLPLLPLVLPQAHLTSGHHRADTTIEENSAQLADYGRLPETALGDRSAPWLLGTGGLQRLYPGTLLLGAALGGWWVGRRGGERRWVRFLLAGTAVAFIGSLGLRLDLGGSHPYALLRDHLPGFENLRSPFRFAALVQVLLVPLAALGLDEVWRRRSLGGAPMVLALTAVGLVEVLALPVSLVAVPDADDSWIGWLGDRPDGAAVAMVPFADGPAAEDFEPTVEAMLAGLEHRHPLANGYSGLFPAAHDRLWDAVGTFPDGEALEALSEADVTYVVVDADWLTPDLSAAIDREPRLDLRTETAEASVYELLPGAGRADAVTS